MPTARPVPGPDVTVVVIVYNDAERLPRAVRSVLGQSLRNLEVIIVDDCSTDATRATARRLAASDRRVRCLRLPVNSGGCGAPRNAGIEAAAAPHVMFLDSDDELPYHACKSLLLAAEETGADLVTGEVTRNFEETGTTGLWYPELFGDVRVVDGIRAAPEYFLDHLSTNKLYRADFLARHRLRFPEGVHYEDQLFSAQAFTLARTFAVVPWPVYTWWLAADPDRLSISSSRHRIRNAMDRVLAARLIDAFLEESGNADLRPAKDEKFLRHDLRLYLGDLPFRELWWITEFAAVVTPYLRTLAPEALAAMPREQRVCQYLLEAGRFAEAAECARTLDRPHLAPRHVVREGGRVYWGRTPPEGPEAAAGLDVTDWRLDEQPFTTGPLCHEVARIDPAGPLLRVLLHTYDPARLLAGAEPVTAELRIATTAEPLTVPFRYDPPHLGPDGTPGPRTAEIDLDPRRIPLGVTGFRGRRHPVVVLERMGLTRTDPLLAPATLPPLRTRLPQYGPLGAHSVRMGCEGHGAGRLELTWERTGALGRAETAAPRLRPARRRVQRLTRRVTGPRAKALTYHELQRLPVDDTLVVFEALEGRGYADSPRALHEEILRRGLPLRAVWSCAGPTSSYPEGVPLVRRGSWEYVRTLARARYWIDSHGFPTLYGKRPGTRYLQTWHGQALKHMGFDVPELRLAGPERQRRHREAVARWDALIAPSEEFERTFVRANGYTGRLLRTGLPRNDALVRWNDPEQRDRAATARARLQVPDGRKVLLYAPTFRDGARGTGESVRVDLAELVRRTGEEWTVVVRPHYYERFAVPRELGHAVRDGRQFPDLNDLLLASDALLTDYSSVMFDYANLGRPILLWADDYAHYRSTARGLYYDLPEIAPGPMLTTVGELAAGLADLGALREEWAGAYGRFQARFNPYETGRSSGAVVDLFFEELVSPGGAVDEGATPDPPADERAATPVGSSAGPASGPLLGPSAGGRG
ncbi:bifunctional glycosyltransferase family 2 protein/CDP-glycerol:glycerophosphate glycerophosphotransferase [Streptomyces sp. HU2014]|uniref:bifunctional glycosyltransferase/CDP-glycerol:glycerophosphate glycerophosphotransferase n=1 Tax=Streptomyces sp. HU2014 TaxID=2939414 RepID=UPI00200D71AD|nr:CDP-glycerol glycerophosphotransferase family protein [Streptomyces sp. HU2014]UQI43437.1 bifunctional glycosyltransferase family 2 protein/CDP-glycerol:glycerophosphate glycerophosphotransferase [Streptomyces sp. HU2014]